MALAVPGPEAPPPIVMVKQGFLTSADAASTPSRLLAEHIQAQGVVLHEYTARTQAQTGQMESDELVFDLAELLVARVLALVPTEAESDGLQAELGAQRR